MLRASCVVVVRRLVLVASIALAVSPSRPLSAQASRDAALAELVASERAFANYADTANIPAAFLWALREDAITLDADGVKQMRPLYAARRPGPAKLRWEPSWADISADGTMGVTTGPWSWAPAQDSAVKARGNFLTIWKRGPDRWQVALDLGVSGDSTADLGEALLTMPAGVSGRARLTDITGLERSRVKGNGWLHALQGLAATDVRVLREGVPRATGRAALTGTTTTRFVSVGGTVSSSGDLAGTWGTWSDGAKRGSYVRIWKHTAGGWRVVIDRMGD